jgi:hypothetical protein
MTHPFQYPQGRIYQADGELFAKLSHVAESSCPDGQHANLDRTTNRLQSENLATQAKNEKARSAAPSTAVVFFRFKALRPSRIRKNNLRSCAAMSARNAGAISKFVVNRIQDDVSAMLLRMKVATSSSSAGVGKRAVLWDSHRTPRALMRTSGS